MTNGYERCANCDNPICNLMGSTKKWVHEDSDQVSCERAEPKFPPVPSAPREEECVCGGTMVGENIYHSEESCERLVSDPAPPEVREEMPRGDQGLGFHLQIAGQPGDAPTPPIARTTPPAATISTETGIKSTFERMECPKHDVKFGYCEECLFPKDDQAPISEHQGETLNMEPIFDKWDETFKGLAKPEHQGQSASPICLPVHPGDLSRVILVSDYEEVRKVAAQLISALCAKEEEVEKLTRELTRERKTWCDQPEDRLYHNSDRTWWKRDSDGDPKHADPPSEVTELRKQLTAADEAYVRSYRLRTEMLAKLDEYVNQESPADAYRRGWIIGIANSSAAFPLIPPYAPPSTPEAKN